MFLTAVYLIKCGKNSVAVVHHIKFSTIFHSMNVPKLGNSSRRYNALFEFSCIWLLICLIRWISWIQQEIIKHDWRCFECFKVSHKCLFWVMAKFDELNCGSKFSNKMPIIRHHHHYQCTPPTSLLLLLVWVSIEFQWRRHHDYFNRNFSWNQLQKNLEFLTVL